MNSCACGHSPEEHGHDVEHTGSTACTGCDCIAFDEDEPVDAEGEGAGDGR